MKDINVVLNYLKVFVCELSPDLVLDLRRSARLFDSVFFGQTSEKVTQKVLVTLSGAKKNQ